MTRISIIIPVYDEAENLRALLPYLRASFPAETEIVVVDGHPLRTSLASIQSRDIVKLATPAVRALQMNRGASIASGDTLLFLHADTRPPANAAALIRTCFVDEGALCGGFQLGVDSAKWSYRLMAKLSTLRSRITNELYGDQGLFIRAQYFRELGGFDEGLPFLEDVDVMRRIHRDGHGIRILEAAVITSPRRLVAEGVPYVLLRNALVVLLFRLGVPASRLKRLYKYQYELTRATPATHGNRIGSAFEALRAEK